tara:strand:+ start:15075 stop:18665 length:3591 start_codon:yes stop_codon:yes gene_type:complete
MSNILGEPFDEYVNGQIDARQQIHGKSQRNIEEISYLNSTSGWVKLASGTSMDQSRLDLLKAGNNLMLKGVAPGKDLAMRNVLFNGLTAYTQKWDLDKIEEANKSTNMAYSVKKLEKSGYRIQERFLLNPTKVNYTGIGKGGTVAYGADGTDFGYSPMPGITDLNVKDLNRGSIKKATLNIKANNRNQLEVIDALYMRLGYTILLEWGHNQYWDDTKNKLIQQPPSLIDTIFFKDRYDDSDYSQFLPKILEQRKLTRGNYDAMFGTVSNFSWTFNNDGSYNIKIEIISLGDIIESLGIGVSTVSSTFEQNPIIESILPKYKKKEAQNEKEFYEDLYPTLKDALSEYYSKMVSTVNNNPDNFPIKLPDSVNYYELFPGSLYGKNTDLPQKYEESYSFVNPIPNNASGDQLKQKDNIDIIFQTKQTNLNYQRINLVGLWMWKETRKYLNKSIYKVTLDNKGNVSGVSSTEKKEGFGTTINSTGIGDDGKKIYPWGGYKMSCKDLRGEIGLQNKIQSQPVSRLQNKKTIGFNQLGQSNNNGNEGIGINFNATQSFIFSTINKQIIFNHILTFESFCSFIFEKFQQFNKAGGEKDPRFKEIIEEEPPENPNEGENQIADFQKISSEKSVRGNIFKYFYDIRFFYEPKATPSKESVENSVKRFWWDDVPLNDLAEFEGLDSQPPITCYRKNVGYTLNPLSLNSSDSNDTSKKTLVNLWNKTVKYPIYKNKPLIINNKPQQDLNKDFGGVSKATNNYLNNNDPTLESSIYSAYNSKGNRVSDLNSRGTDFVKINATNLSKSFYIRLGILLSYIRDNSIPVISSRGNNKPLINIDVNNGLNLCYVIDNTISLDPSKIIVSNKNFTNGIGKNQIFEGLNDFVITTDKGSYGNLMNVYFNFSRVEEILEDLMRKDGTVILFDFIDALCSDINESLGGVNNLEPNVDENTNTIRIIDQTNIPNIKNQFPEKFKKQSTTLEVFGYNIKNKSSNFVHSIGLTTQISKEYATMITIGATSKGSVPGTEATAFSKWNIGITDRFKNNLTNPDQSNSDDKTPEEQLYEDNKTTIKNYSQNITREFAILGFENEEKNSKQYLTFNNNIIKNNLKVAKDFYKYEQALSSISNDKDDITETSVGFIPFNLSVDMEGISGMKIYNRLKVNTAFLPSNYDKTLDFIVTGVNHKISGNVWKTSLSTLATSKSVLNKK